MRHPNDQISIQYSKDQKRIHSLELRRMGLMAFQITDISIVFHQFAWKIVFIYLMRI